MVHGEGQNLVHYTDFADRRHENPHAHTVGSHRMGKLYRMRMPAPRGCTVAGRRAATAAEQALTVPLSLLRLATTRTHPSAAIVRHSSIFLFPKIGVFWRAPREARGKHTRGVTAAQSVGCLNPDCPGHGSREGAGYDQAREPLVSLISGLVRPYNSRASYGPLYCSTLSAMEA